MTEGPLNEGEMAWLEETLISYGTRCVSHRRV
jgi:hypothetical protein